MEIRIRKSAFEPEIVNGPPKRGLLSQFGFENNYQINIREPENDQFIKKQALHCVENPSSPRSPRTINPETVQSIQGDKSYTSPRYVECERPRTNQIHEKRNERITKISSWMSMLDTFVDVAKENYPLLDYLKNLDQAGIRVLGQIERTSFSQDLYHNLKKQPRSSIPYLLKRIEKFFENGKRKQGDFNSNFKKFLDIFNDYEISDDESTNDSYFDSEKAFSCFASENIELIKYEEIIFENKIGEGAYSEVFLASYAGKRYAVKKMREMEDLSIQYSRLFREIIALKNIQNVPNTVQIKGYCIRPYSCIVLELVEGRSLDQIQLNKLSFEEKIEISVKLAVIIKSLHSLEPPLIHRDISLQNVMISSNRKLQPILGDFGISILKTKMSEESPSNLIGHPRYRPPEISLKESYGKKVDVYCFGSFLCELFSGRRVAEGLTDAEVCRMRIQCEDILIPQNVHPELCTIIKKCWSHNPKQRPSVSEVINSLESISRTSHHCPSSSAQ